MKYIKILLSLLVLFFLPSFCFADIPSPNKGEQNMITKLRLTINANEYLKKQDIVIGAGTSGCEAFKQRGYINSIKVLLTWQWLETIANLPPNTIVVVPEHAVDDNFKKIKNKINIVTIDGVLHMLTMDNIKKQNTAFIKPHPEMVVMLAGDTQQQTGKWLMYTPQMVNELLFMLPTNKNILFLNGPRTGMYKETLGPAGNALIKDDTAHRTTTDELTKFVINNSGNNPWQFIDFKYEATDHPWWAALKFCLEHPTTILLLPGESTTAITEALSLGIHPFIYEHPAMTPISREYVRQLIKQNKATLYTRGPLNHITTQQPPLALQENKICEKLLLMLENKCS